MAHGPNSPKWLNKEKEEKEEKEEEKEEKEKMASSRADGFAAAKK